MLHEEIEKQKNPYFELLPLNDARLSGISSIYPFIMLRSTKGMLYEFLKTDKVHDDHWDLYAGISLLEDAEQIYQAHKGNFDFILFDNTTGIPYSFEEVRKNENH